MAEVHVPREDGVTMVYSAEGELVREENLFNTTYYLHGRRAYRRNREGRITYLAKDGRQFFVHAGRKFVLEIIPPPGSGTRAYMTNPDPDVVGRFKTVIEPSASSRARSEMVELLYGTRGEGKWQSVFARV